MMTFLVFILLELLVVLELFEVLSFCFSAIPSSPCSLSILRIVLSKSSLSAFMLLSTSSNVESSSFHLWPAMLLALFILHLGMDKCGPSVVAESPCLGEFPFP